MELGTGIFLSAVFLGSIGLYSVTRDRWNWKKIVFRLIGALAGLLAIAGGVAYVYKESENRPKKLTEYWGVSLGEAAADVKFKKGEPTNRIQETVWQYRPYQTIEGDFIVAFRNERVRSILYYGPRLNAPNVHGVGNYDSVSDLEKKLGPASFVSRSKDELTRIYSFEKFNIAVQFSKGEMEAVGIYDADTGPLRFSNEHEAAEKKSR
jgi:hypothetical protein